MGVKKYHKEIKIKPLKLTVPLGVGYHKFCQTQNNSQHSIEHGIISTSSTSSYRKNLLNKKKNLSTFFGIQ